MRQIIKMAKNGQEIIFLCSVCGNLIYNIIVPVGKVYEPDWNNIQEICVCGTRVLYRSPIIDDKGIDIIDDNRKSGNHRKNVHKKIKDRAEDRADLYNERVKDLESAISIDYFEMRLECLKKDNFNVPNNIDHLKMECIKRNISHIELSFEHMSHLNDSSEKEVIQERLNILKQEYSGLTKKLEDKKY